MEKQTKDERAFHYAQQCVVGETKLWSYECSVCHLVQKFDFDHVICSFGCSASFCRIYEVFCSLGVWFVNCVKYFDKTSQFAKLCFSNWKKL